MAQKANEGQKVRFFFFVSNSNRKLASFFFGNEGDCGATGKAGLNGTTGEQKDLSIS